MSYKVRFARRATADIDHFFDYLSDYSPDIAAHYKRQLTFSIERNVAARPLSYQFFFLTGAPYRASLFRVGRRTTYWIVFRIDEEAKAIEIARFWNSVRDPQRFEV